MRNIQLTDQEVVEIVTDLMELLAHVEDGAPLDPNLGNIVRDWCLVLLDRLNEQGGPLEN